MTKAKRRLYMVLLGVAALGTATALVLAALKDQIVYFYSPTDLQSKHVVAGRHIRIGGLVEEGSLLKEGAVVNFRITDTTTAVTVTYTGVLPDLFREGQGVVAEGSVDKDNLFHADTILAKHDEKYMPPEVADALKKSGQWKGETPK
jgi:cytochrome c-type biogenesis protein CcmE